MRKEILASVCSFLLVVGMSYGAMVVQHVGATDPTTEGWTLNGNGAQASALTPDAGYGVNAWATADTLNSECSYQFTPTAQQTSDALTLGYTLSATLRLPDANMGMGDIGNLYVKLNGNRYVVLFSTDANAIPTLYVWNSAHSYVNTSYTLSSAGYHTYSLVHDGATGKADLLVDGAVVMDDMSPDIDDVSDKVIFGNGSSAASGRQSNWSAVEFSIVPEPATMVVLTLGGLFSVLRRRRAN